MPVAQRSALRPRLQQTISQNASYQIFLQVKHNPDFRAVDGRCRTGTSAYRSEKKQSRLRSCSYSRFSAVPFLNKLGVFAAILIAIMIKTAYNQKRRLHDGGESQERTVLCANR